MPDALPDELLLQKLPDPGRGSGGLHSSEAESSHSTRRKAAAAMTEIDPSQILPDFVTGDTATGLAQLRKRLLNRSTVAPLLDLAVAGDTTLPLHTLDLDALMGALSSGYRVEIGGETRLKSSEPPLTGIHLDETALASRLRRIAALARRGQAAAGRPRLHLVLGLLARPAHQKTGHTGSDTGGHAPLILMPVTLVRNGRDGKGHQLYGLEIADGDASDNPLLRDVLSRDYGLTLPVLAPGESPKDYFARIQEDVVAKQSDWRLLKQAALAFLAPVRYRLYQSLDPRQLTSLEDRPLLRDLFQGPSAKAQARPTEAKDINLDSRGIDHLPALFLDADQDQMSALIESLEERRNLVLSAPNGTGRAQTICNMIGGALWQGRSVLYVAGGKPSLHAIEAKLERLGLTNFCLDLTGSRGGRRDVLRQLSQRLRMTATDFDPLSSKALQKKRNDLESKKRRLARYARLMTAGFGEAAFTPHEIVWGAERFRLELEGKDGRKAPPPLNLGDVSKLSAEKIGTQRAKIGRLRNVLREIERLDQESGGNVWRGFFPGKGLLDDEDGKNLDLLSTALEKMESAAKGLQKGLTELRDDIGIHYPPTEGVINNLIRLRNELPVIPLEGSCDLLPRLTSKEAGDIIEQLRRDIPAYREGAAMMERSFGRSWTGLSHGEVEQAQRLADEVLAAVPASTPVMRLSGTAADFRRGSAQIRTGLEVFEDILALLGLNLAPSPAASQFLRTVLSIASVAPMETLDMRSKGLVSREAPQVLMEAREVAQRLIDREEQLAQTFNMMGLPTAEELSQASWALMRGGVTASLSKGYRDAKKLFQSLLTTDAEGKFSDPQVMAHKLSELADWRLDVDTYAANGKFQRMLGKSFRGIYTEFDKLDRLLQWLKRINASLMPSLDEVGDGGATAQDMGEALSMEMRATLAKKLVTADNDLLHNLGAIYHESAEKLDPLMKVPDPRRRAREWIDTADRLAQAAELTSEMGVIVDATVHDCFEALKRFDFLKKARQTIENNPRAQSMLGAHYHGLDTNIMPISVTRDWAIAVQNTKGMPEKITQWLLVADARTRYQRLLEILSTINRHARELGQARSEMNALGRTDWRVWYDLPAEQPEEGRKGKMSSAPEKGAKDKPARPKLQSSQVMAALAKEEETDPEALAALDALLEESADSEVPETKDEDQPDALESDEALAALEAYAAAQEEALIHEDALAKSQHAQTTGLPKDVDSSAPTGALSRSGAVDYMQPHFPVHADVGLETIGQRARQGLGALSSLQAWAKHQRLRRDVAQSGLKPLLEATEKGLITPQKMLSYFDYSLYSGLSRILVKSWPELDQLAKLDLDKLAAEFSALDHEIIDLNRRHLLLMLLERKIPRDEPTTAARREPGYATGLQAIRQALTAEETEGEDRMTLGHLLRQAGGTIQAMLPCTLATPESLAEHMAVDGSRYDLVILDDAGRLSPELAALALACGRQAIIAGDGAETGGLQPYAAKLYQPVRPLIWDHRNAHDSLTAFSSSQFHEDRVAVLPAPSTANALGWKPITRGRFINHVNEAEAKTLVLEAVKHLTKGPDAGSLGIVAFTHQQRDLIERLLEEATDRDPKLTAALSGAQSSGEAAFVITADGLAGEARDRLLISLTYGPDGDGALPEDWGVLMEDRGRAAMAALTAAARRDITIFASVEPEDLIDLTRIEGMRLLQALMLTAQEGIAVPGPACQPGHFEAAIAQLLESKGFRAIPRFGPPGSAGVDIAVGHKKLSGRFPLAIEGDGATARTGRSTRDRDRLRGEALKAMGWEVHHVRTLDWHLNREKAEIALLEAANRAVRRALGLPEATPKPEEDDDRSQAQDGPQTETESSASPSTES